LEKERDRNRRRTENNNERTGQNLIEHPNRFDPANREISRVHDSPIQESVQKIGKDAERKNAANS